MDVDTTLVPARLAQWKDSVFQAASETNGAISPFLLFGLMDRESLGGEALKPKGPTGTGDWTPRALSKRYQPGGLYKATILERTTKDANGEPHLERIPAVMPADGLGWGRGLYQADLASHTAFCISGGWKDPLKAGRQACAELVLDLRLFVGDVQCMLAGYNAGPDAVRHAIASLGNSNDPVQRLAALDFITEGHNYVSDILRRMKSFTPAS